MTLAVGGSSGLPGDGGSAAAAEKAGRFFDRGRDVADAGNFDYAIELFIHGLSIDPNDVSAHKELRLIALERKARGGNDIAAFDKIKLRESLAKSADALKTMLTAEKMLAFDPADVESMKAAAKHAHAAGLAKPAQWFERLIEEAGRSTPS